MYEVCSEKGVPMMNISSKRVNHPFLKGVSIRKKFEKTLLNNPCYPYKDDLKSELKGWMILKDECEQPFRVFAGLPTLKHIPYVP